MDKRVIPNKQFDQVVSPERPLRQARRWVQKAVQLIAVCRGIEPEHIRFVKEGLPVQPPAP